MGYMKEEAGGDGYGDRGRSLNQSKSDSRLGNIGMNSGVVDAQVMAQVQVVNFKEVF